MKRKLSFLLLMTVIISLFTGFSTYAVSDISDHWAEDIITKWTEAGKINGYEDGTFKPDNNMTRAEFAKILAVVLNQKIAQHKDHSFSDVKESDWFYEYIRTLVTLNIVDANESFRPNELITRQDVMEMAGRAFYYSSENEEILKEFTDANKISDYAKEYVIGLIESGIINGYEDKTIRPENNITRAECVKILDGFNVVKDIYSLAGIMTRIYEGVDEELPNTMQMEITKETSGYYLGIENMEFEEAIASEPMIGSIAHSICLVKVKDGTDIEKVKAEIKEKVDPRKWVCVGVEREDVIVANKGNIILLIIDEIAPKKFEESFMALEVERKN